MALERELAEADRLLQADKTEEGIALLIEIAERHPTDAEPLFRIGAARMDLEDPVGARHHFVRALERDPCHEASLLALSAIHAEEGNLDQSFYLIEKAIEATGGPLDPRSVESRSALAFRLAEIGEIDRAAEILRAIVGRVPGGLTLETTSQAVALTAFELKRGDVEAARALVANLETTFPGEPDALLARAHFAGSTGDPKEALETYRRLLALEPEAPVQLEMIHLALEAGDDAQAMKLVDEATALDPEEIWPWLEKASLKRRAGDDSGAITILDLAHKTFPDEPEPLFRKAEIFSDKKRYKEALDVLDTLLEADPDHAEAEYLYGFCLAELGEKEAAEGAFRRALDIDPEFTWPMVGLAALYDDLGEWDRALGWYHLALEYDPGDGATELDLAELYDSLGDLRGARRHAEAALRVDPDLVEADLLLATLLLENHDREGAVAHFKKATARGVDDLVRLRADVRLDALKDHAAYLALVEPGVRFEFAEIDPRVVDLFRKTLVALAIASPEAAENLKRQNPWVVSGLEAVLRTLKESLEIDLELVRPRRKSVQPPTPAASGPPPPKEKDPEDHLYFTVVSRPGSPSEIEVTGVVTPVKGGKPRRNRHLVFRTADDTFGYIGHDVAE